MRSGHVINESFQDYPEFNTKHCKECGAKTITTCPSCSASIPGHYRDSNVITFRQMPTPAFCHDCGEPYPWTKTGLQAAAERRGEGSPRRRHEGGDARHTQSKVAVERIKCYGKKMGDAAYKVFLEVFTDVASEYTKKMLGL